MEVSYEEFTVQKLKQELIRRQAATTGRKSDLIERLKAYDRNDDFRGMVINLPEPLDATWPSSGFTQLLPHHQGILPPISKELTEGYFVFRMAEDLQTVNDLKALEKGARMFTANRVLACSVLFEGLSTYFSGIVGASMKNKVSYNYKIKADETGAPVISHCECPAGKGSHATCKHIAAVLLMAEHFVSTGSLHVERSCTENLQTFHKPKSTYKDVLCGDVSNEQPAEPSPDTSLTECASTIVSCPTPVAVNTPASTASTSSTPSPSAKKVKKMRYTQEDVLSMQHKVLEGQVEQQALEKTRTNLETQRLTLQIELLQRLLSQHDLDINLNPTQLLMSMLN